MPDNSRSLTGYGHLVHVRYNFICAYCGFDGRPFPNWLQLSVDHIVPTSAGGSDDDHNKVTACLQCNSITSRMSFPPGTTKEQAVAAKVSRVRQRQSLFFDFWKEKVAPNYLAHWRGGADGDPPSQP